MKILFLTSSMGGGGAERVAALLANAWATHGHDVTLMPTFSARGECVYQLAEKVELEFLSDHCKPRASRLMRLKILRRFIGALRPHVIVSFLPHVNIGALIAARGTGIPVVACERTYPPRLMPPLPLSYRILRRLTYPWAAALVAQTEATAKWLRRRARRAKTVVISNPISLPMVDADPVIPPAALLKSGDRVILWVGRMDAAKRPDIMVDAFARLAGAAKEWKLVMLGDGPLRPMLQAMLAERGLDGRMFLPGFAGNLASWYGRADLYVMTSSYEGFPNSLLEAMAHGVASVAFDVETGPAQLSDGGRRLRLLPDNSHVERLQNTLHDLMADDPQRAVLSRTGREVADVYSLDTILSEWDSLLRNVAAEAQDAPEPNSS